MSLRTARGSNGAHGQDPGLDQNLAGPAPGRPRPASAGPQIERIDLRFRAGFAYVDALLPGGETLRLCRLRYTGYANDWGFAIYRASHDDYEDSCLPTGIPVGTAEQALDTACGLYLERPHRLDLNPRRTNEHDH